MTTKQLTVMAICAHPDDAELHCAGLLLKAQLNGATIGVLDLTRGEAASRGSVAIRQQEAAQASKILGLTVRDNLALPDAHLQVDNQTIKLIVAKIRHYRPQLVITSYYDDHHPDHQATGLLVQKACYLAGIGNYHTENQQTDDQQRTLPHRPEQVMYFLDRLGHKPDVVQDISEVFEQKLAAVKCYASQLYSHSSQALITPVSSSNYLNQWASRQQHYGSLIGVEYGEGYMLRSPVALNNPLNLLWGRQGLV